MGPRLLDLLQRRSVHLVLSHHKTLGPHSLHLLRVGTIYFFLRLRLEKTRLLHGSVGVLRNPSTRTTVAPRPPSWVTSLHLLSHTRRHPYVVQTVGCLDIWVGGLQTVGTDRRFRGDNSRTSVRQHQINLSLLDLFTRNKRQ